MFVKVLDLNKNIVYGKIVVSFSGTNDRFFDQTAGIKILTGEYKGYTLPYRRKEIVKFM